MFTPPPTRLVPGHFTHSQWGAAGEDWASAVGQGWLLGSSSQLRGGDLAVLGGRGGGMRIRLTKQTSVHHAWPGPCRAMHASKSMAPCARTAWCRAPRRVQQRHDGYPGAPSNGRHVVRIAQPRGLVTLQRLFKRCDLLCNDIMPGAVSLSVVGHIATFDRIGTDLGTLLQGQHPQLERP